MYSAQMRANELFDTHTSAASIWNFLEMARVRKRQFQRATEKEVQSLIAEAESVIENLNPTIKVLRQRRNDFLAHLSPKLAFTPELLQKATRLTIPQIGEVLYEGGKMVNQFLHVWNASQNQLREANSDDYKKIVGLVSKQLCAEIQAHERKFKKYGMSQRLPRPKDCP